MLILVVAEGPVRARAVDEALRSAGYDRVQCVEPGGDLLARVAALDPDVVLIDVDAPTAQMLERVGEVGRRKPRPVVLFTRDGDDRTIREAVRAGVSAYVVDGLTAARVRPIIDVAVARFSAMQALKDELDRTRATLERRKLIDRAKGVIMAQRGCGEPAAYHLLRRLAMNQQTTMGEIARRLITADEVFGAKGGAQVSVSGSGRGDQIIDKLATPGDAVA